MSVVNEMDEKLSDFELYSKNFLKIQTKSGTLAPFIFNVYQSHLWKIIKNMLEKGVPIRLIILKARQLGISTFFSAFTYWLCTLNFYRRGLIVANDADANDNIFEMCKTFYLFSDPKVRPMQKYSNKKELVFANPDDKTADKNPGLLSHIKVQTAGKKSVGRSGTNHILHLTEFAFWQNAGTVVTGLFQVCPFLPGSSIVIESTANGMCSDGEEFYLKYTAAEQGESVSLGDAGDGGMNGDFVPIFFPYYWNPEYTKPDHNMVLTGYEQHLLKEYKDLTKENLAWRRWKIKNEMGNAQMSPEDQFKQEYPISAQEAFLMSGRPVFDPLRIQSDMDICKNVEYKRGQFV